MAELAGLLVGGISVLALFGTVQDGYRFIISVKDDFKNESNFLITKLQVEHDRLHTWGRYMGISETENGRMFHKQPKPTQALCKCGAIRATRRSGPPVDLGHLKSMIYISTSMPSTRTNNSLWLASDSSLDSFLDWLVLCLPLFVATIFFFFVIFLR